MAQFPTLLPLLVCRCVNNDLLNLYQPHSFNHQSSDVVLHAAAGGCELTSGMTREGSGQVRPDVDCHLTSGTTSTNS